MKSKGIMRFMSVMTAGLLLFTTLSSQGMIASATAASGADSALIGAQAEEGRGGNAATEGMGAAPATGTDEERAGSAADDTPGAPSLEVGEERAVSVADEAVNVPGTLPLKTDGESDGLTAGDGSGASAEMGNPALEADKENDGIGDMANGSVPGDMACPHHPQHTEECGYVSAADGTEGSACCYVCRVCPVEERIATLPDEVTDENIGEVRVLLDEILSLFTLLTEEEQEQIDLSRCYELQAVLDESNQSAVVEEGDFGPDNAFHWALTGTQLTISGSGDMPDGFHQWWYNYRDKIQSAVIEEGITSVGNNTFVDCPKLSLVTIASSVTEIGDKAFSRCPMLSTVRLPEGITSIGNSAFASCTNLYLTKLPDSLLSMGEYAFQFCKKMSISELPSGLAVVGKGALGYCSGLKLTKLPDTLNTIGEDAFWGCTGISLTELPDGLKRIEANTFRDCNITALTVPASVEYIGTYGLGGCIGLVEITFLGDAPELNGMSPIQSGALKRLFLSDDWESKGYTAENKWPVDKIVIYVEPYFDGPSEKTYNDSAMVPHSLKIKLRPVSEKITVTPELQTELDSVANNISVLMHAFFDDANAGENKTITARGVKLPSGYDGRFILAPDKTTITTNGTITKAQPTAKFDFSVVPNGITYRSATLQVTNRTGSPRDGKIEYSMDNGKTWQSSPTFENLRYNTEYTFTARVAESMNYLPSKPVECTAATEKAPLDGTDEATGEPMTTATAISTHVYTGLAQELSEEDVQVLWNGEAVDSSQYTVGNLSGNIQAGMASFTITANAGGDFTGAAQGQFEIKPAEPQIVWNDQTLEYTGKAAVPAAPTVTLLNGDTGEIKTTYVRYIDEILPDGTVTSVEQHDLPTDAGNYEITAQISVENQNYASVEKKITLTIAPAMPAIAWADTSETLTYTGKPVEITGPEVTLVNGESFDGTISYSYQKDGGTAWSEGLPINAGVYNVKARVEAGGNYTAAESSNLLALTIDKAIGILAIPNAEISRPYGQKAFSLDCSANSDGKITYASSDTSVLTVDKDGMATAHWVGEAIVTVALDESDNYTGAVEQRIIVTVTKSGQPENMPANTLVAEYPCAKISDVPLPDGWVWAEADCDTALMVGIPVEARAEYTGADAECFTVTTAEIAITRAACKHPDTELCGAKEATCTAEGYTGDICCVDCGEKLELGTAIVRVPHSYTSNITKEPTTTEEGVRTYTCAVCGATYTEPIEKLPEQPGSTDKPEEPEQPGSTDKPTEPEQPSSKPQGGQPFIKGDADKNGWDIIRTETAKAKDGDTVTVEMNGASVVPGVVLDDIHGRGISLVFEMEQGVTWRIDGKTITEDKMPDIDFTIRCNGNTIPVPLVDAIANGNRTIQFDITHTGNLGCMAILTLWLGAEYSGHDADLYYYNASSGKLELQGTDSIAADGCATFTFTHASSYVIVIKDTASGVPTPAPGNSGTGGAPASGAGITSPQTGELSAENAGSSPMDFLWFGILLSLSIVAIFLMVERKRKHN